ncbi:MAG: Gfo/Idh/MocA family protein, partial [Tepidiformaceae bacterium]
VQQPSCDTMWLTARRRPEEVGMALKLVVVGTGLWGRRLIPLFRLHPLVDEIALSDIDAVKLQEASREFGIPRTFPSLEAALDSDFNAIALVTQHWLHAPQAMQALRAGKHVYSSAPAGITVDEIESLVRTVEETGLTYVMGETSYYYSWVYYCRQRYEAGDFGDVVFSDSDYFHDFDHGLRDVFQTRGGERWKEIAVIPPMYYITHCTSQITAVTGARFTHVSCQGFVDKDPDGAFDPNVNEWRNPYSDQAALFRMSDGSSCRVNVYWRVGHPSMVQMSMYGTQGSFEYNCGGATWVDRASSESLTHRMRPGLLAPRFVGSALRKPDWLKRPRWLPSSVRPSRGVATEHGRILDVTDLQPVADLPGEYAGLKDMGGEWGTNYFMVNEFVRACAQGVPPPNNVWAAARYTVPGIVAHESAMRGGELLEVPDFGDPPF